MGDAQSSSHLCGSPRRCVRDPDSWGKGGPPWRGRRLSVVRVDEDRHRTGRMRVETAGVRAVERSSGPGDRGLAIRSSIGVHQNEGVDDGIRDRLHAPAWTRLP